MFQLLNQLNQKLAKRTKLSLFMSQTYFPFIFDAFGIVKLLSSNVQSLTYTVLVYREDTFLFNSLTLLYPKGIKSKHDVLAFIMWPQGKGLRWVQCTRGRTSKIIIYISSVIMFFKISYTKVTLDTTTTKQVVPSDVAVGALTVL